MIANETNATPCHPLTPMQHGMIFNSLYSPASGVEIEQVVCTLDEDLNIPAFMRAWDGVVARHDILRVGFRWEGLAETLQQVVPRVTLTWESHDLRETTAAEQQRCFDEYLTADRRRGFDLRVAPVMRFALFRFGDESYRLVWTIHHALLDLRGFIVTFREVFALYESYARGAEAELPEPQGRYWDYVNWVARRAEHAATSERFWKETLEGFDSPTPLPQATQRADAGTPSPNDFGELSVRLSREATARLKALSDESGITTSVFVLGAWALLLSRYSGEQDVVFGTTRTCRRWGQSPETDWSVGLFVSTIPFRARVREDATLLEWLGELRASWSAAARHVHTPFTMIQEWGRMRYGIPLFESIVGHAHEELSTTLRAQGGDWNRRSIRIINQTSYPLALASYGEEELLLKLKYDARRFGDELPARILEQLLTILRETAENPSRKLSSLTFLTDDELHRQLVEWNANEFVRPHDRCVHELVEEQAEKRPDALAVSSGAEQLTYRELNRRADVLAARLRRMGVGPEMLVGVCLERSAQLAVAALAVLKAGGAYLPLDPSHPAARLQRMLEDSGARALLTRRGLAGLFDGADATVVCMDADQGRTGEASTEACAAPVRVTGENLAYVIYTSGSTGEPKGVAVRHAGLTNLVNWYRLAYGVTDAHRGTLMAGPAFDASAWELWSYLTAGASLHVPDEATRTSVPEMLRWFADEGVTDGFLPTAMAEATLTETLPAGLSLRLLMTGGDKLKRVPPAGLPYQVLNLYGPTEYTVVTTHAAVAPGAAAAGAPSIGRPVGNTRVYLLDSRLRALPPGAMGELYIAGEGLARGYLNRPDLTAERFVPDPFSAEPGGRLYRTGDLCRYQADGEIEFVGRLDQQVKVRGYRIELGEIEAALSVHGSVLHAVVTAHRGQSGDSRLVAYVVAAEGRVADACELREHLRERLPEYMVPSQFVLLDELPLTPNGKVDRKRLPEPEAAQARAESADVTLLTPVGRLIADIWREALGVERIGAEDNFFELGGHSLLATRVITCINQTCQVELTLRSLFERPTLDALARSVEAAKLSGQRKRIPRVSRRARRDVEEEARPLLAPPYGQRLGRGLEKVPFNSRPDSGQHLNSY